MRILLPWLLAFAIALQCLSAQDQTGFISIDCGSDAKSYVDETTSLNYISDDEYTQSGKPVEISLNSMTTLPLRQYRRLRSFDESTAGSRICYTLTPIHGKGHRILLRLGFLYGNYDRQNTIPKFDLQLGANDWETVIITSISEPVILELMHVPRSDYVDVCLVNTGHGTPFINLIELRPINDSIYNTTSDSISLRLIQRSFFGGTDAQTIRYSNDNTYTDNYDRRWLKWTDEIPNTINVTAEIEIGNENYFNLPFIIRENAIQAPTVNDSISINLYPRNPGDQTYLYLHFNEVEQETSTYIYVYLNEKVWYASYHIQSYGTYSIYSRASENEPRYSFQISAGEDSSNPPIINAIEFYGVQNFDDFETDQYEVAAIKDVKLAYRVGRNWQGDPCRPMTYKWNGIECQYNESGGPSHITSLNLSSQLTGDIALSISNMTMLRSLNLSNNGLSGEVPDWLAQLSNLQILDISRNNFHGLLPAELLEKSRNMSLNFISDAYNQTTSGAISEGKRGKRTLIVPIVAPIVAVFALCCLVFVLWIIAKKKRRNIKGVTKGTNEAHKGGHSIIEPRFRRYEFAELQDFMHENRIIGRGGFGIVYHGILNGTDVAIKNLTEASEQDFKDFQSEVKILATVHHKNLTSVLGYFYDGRNKGIILEFLERGNLSAHLSAASPTILNWEQRLQIVTDVAEGLQYLHHGCSPPIIHRDIKPSNILLTKDFRAKLADFGFSKPFELESIRVVGTIGYRDPAYIHPGMLSEKVDIYSFGVVLLQLVTGQSPTLHGSTHITGWVHSFIDKGDIQGIVDPRLQQNFDINVAWRVVELAMKCVSQDAYSRPNMNYVVKELKECWASTVAPDDYDDKSSPYSNSSSSAIRHSMVGRMFQPYTR